MALFSFALMLVDVLFWGKISLMEKDFKLFSSDGMLPYGEGGPPKKQPTAEEIDLHRQELIRDLEASGIDSETAKEVVDASLSIDTPPIDLVSDLTDAEIESGL